MGENRTQNEQSEVHEETGVWSPILDATTAMIATLDGSGRILRVNQTFADSVGCTRDDLEGRELWELLEAEQVNLMRDLFADAPALQEPQILKLRWLAGDHHRRPATWMFSPVEADDSAARLILGVGLDVSGNPPPAADPESTIEAVNPDVSRVDTDDDDVDPLNESPTDSDTIAIGHLMRPLVEHSSDIICVMEIDGTLVYVSPPVHAVLGYDPDELFGRNAFELVHADDLAGLEPIVTSGLETPGSFQRVQCRVQHADGSWRMVDARGVTHRDGHSLRVVVNVTDITERMRAEEALAESEERFRSAFDNSAIGKVLWTPDGQVEWVNRAVCDMLGYDEAELLQMTWRDQVHVEDLKNLRTGLRRVLDSNLSSLQADCRVHHKDGPWIWARVTISVIKDSGGEPEHIIGELEDITERRLLEEEKRARLQRIQRQQAAIVIMATSDVVDPDEHGAAFAVITEASAEALHVQRVSVWLYSDDRNELRCFDAYSLDDNRHTDGEVLDVDRYPSYFQALEDDRVIEADDARTDLRTRELIDDYLEPHGVISILDAPIRIAGKTVGVVCHERVGEPRIWQADEIKFAGEVANQAAHAMVSAQRKRAERRLRISEERFRSIVNSSPMGLLMYRLEEDDSLVLTGANPAANEILGVDCQKYLGKTIEEAFPPLAETEIPGKYRRAAANGIPWHIEQIEYQDELIRGAYEVHAFQTAPGTVTVLFVEITDRKRAEEALRESEERYRLLFERNLAAVYRSTLDGRIVECNDAFASIFALSSRSEALSLMAEDFYPTQASRDELIAALQESGELRDHEMVLKRSDGQPVWVLANMSLVGDGDGRPTMIEGTMIDITQRKRAADRLVLQSSALEAAANAIVITDPEASVQWVNQAFTRLTGYTASEAIGENLWHLKSGRDDLKMFEDLVKTIAEGQAWHGELVNRRKDGRLYTDEITVTPVRGSGGSISHFIAVQQDISERKRMEEQLLQAQKMEAVGRLAGGVAHDFNNLLQAMLGVTELLRRPPADAGDLGSKLQELEELVQRGSQLTRQLLLFSRRDTAKQEELDLNEVVQGTVKLLHRLLRENIELEFEPGDGALPLLADRGQVEQVVMNLAVNACDAMPHGGHLSLITGLEAGAAWLQVSDTGQGIPEEIRDQLFEPFFTTKERGKGTGLGLSVVHGIVTRLGGRIDVDSEVGEGTTIRVTFPAIAVTGRVPQRQGDHTRAVDGEGERVLVVEDDPAVRSSLEEILGVLGYRVTSVGSRGEAARLPAEPGFDLLLSDYVLPDGSGTEIAGELSQRWPDLRVIVMSGYAQDEIVGAEAARGNLNFLQKPFSAQTLSEAVRAALPDVGDSPETTASA